MSKLTLFSAALVATLTASLGASAQSQPWVADSDLGEGVGVRAGNVELHPGVAGEFGYDSNYYQRSGDQPQERPIVDVWRFRLTPSFSLNTLGKKRREAAGGGAPPKLNINANLFAAYNELFQAGSEEPGQLPRRRYLDAGAGLKLDILPVSVVGADLFGDFLRTMEPSNNPETADAWDRDTVRAGTGVTWRPLGGILSWRLGYEFQYHYFEQEAFQDLNNIQHYLDTRGAFRFLPRTALIYDARYGFINYTRDNTTQNGGQNVRSRVGINSLITQRFAAMALVGWAASFYRQDGNAAVHNYDSVTGQAELRYYLMPQPKLQPGEVPVGLSSVVAGVTRDYTNSYLGDYYSRNRGYLGLSYFIANRAVLDLQGGYSYIQYPDFELGGNVIQVDNSSRIDAQLFAEYRVTQTVGINTTLRYDKSLTDVNIPLAPGFVDNLAYSRFQAWLGARWFM